MNPYEYSFPVFKGLQKPLEFMGLRGRFMTLAAGAAGAAIMLYFIGALCFSQIIGLSTGIGAGGALLIYIYIQQKNGLHNKKRCRNTLIYHYLFIRK